MGSEMCIRDSREAMQVNRSITALSVCQFSSERTVVDPNRRPQWFLIQCHVCRNRCRLHELQAEDKHRVLPLAFARMLTVRDEGREMDLRVQQQVVFDFICTIPDVFREHGACEPRSSWWMKPRVFSAARRFFSCRVRGKEGQSVPHMMKLSLIHI